jgi:nickel-dependent lactate racemase
MPNLDLKYGEQAIRINIAERNLANVIRPRAVKGSPNENLEIKSALANPIGTSRLSEIVRKSDRVAIIVSDKTRPTPTSKLLPPIIEELNSAGVNLRDTTVVFALGAHARHSTEEMKDLVGEKIFNSVRCIDHDTENCVDIGSTRHGTTVEVLKDVLERDALVCTGNIEPHYVAGYSGGLKAILPGVSSRQTIEQNHRMMVDPASRAGKLQGNPVREDIDDVSNLIRVDFLVNAILNDANQIVKVVAGDPITAHRKGVESADRVYKVEVSEKADIVIASAGGYPRDINLYQAQKALENARHVARPGGAIILLAECRNGIGDPTFEQWMREASSPDEVIKRLTSKFVLGGHKAAAFASVMVEHPVYLVSSISSQVANRMHFRAASTAKEALDLAFELMGDDSLVAVLSDGNSTLPAVR